jgi:hypothetical protein
LERSCQAETAKIVLTPELQRFSAVIAPFKSGTVASRVVHGNMEMPDRWRVGKLIKTWIGVSTDG